VSNLKTGLIGAGVFGGYHAGKIAGSTRTQFVGVFDPDQTRCKALADKHGVSAFETQEDLLAATDAVIIACPATYHAAVVDAALKAECHVMVEKPLALTGQAAHALADLAGEKSLILQVGHQERLVLEAMGLLGLPEAPLSIEATRAGPPAPDGRAGDVSVIWDLMIHDLDLAAKLMGAPGEAHATGRIVHSGKIDEATAHVSLETGTAILTASRAADERARHMRLVYPSGEIKIDFLTREVTNTTPHKIQADVSETMPDPLGAADEAFFAACLGERACAIPGYEAAQAVALAEEAEASALNDLAPARRLP